MTFISLVTLLADGIHEISQAPPFAVDENRADKTDNNVSEPDSKLGLRMRQP